MDNNAILIGLITVDNRIVETLKRLLIAQFHNDDLAGVVVLLASFLVGAGEVALLPSLAMFASLGASQASDVILTGIVIGAGANGLDLLGKGWGALVNRVNPVSPVLIDPNALTTLKPTIAQPPYAVIGSSGSNLADPPTA